MSYETVAMYTQSFSLLLFMGIFLFVVAYVLWPKNNNRLEQAARAALDMDAGKNPTGGRK